MILLDYKGEGGVWKGPKYDPVILEWPPRTLSKYSLEILYGSQSSIFISIRKVVLELHFTKKSQLST